VQSTSRRHCAGRCRSTSCCHPPHASPRRRPPPYPSPAVLFRARHDLPSLRRPPHRRRRVPRPCLLLFPPSSTQQYQQTILDPFPPPFLCRAHSEPEHHRRPPFLHSGELLAAVGSRHRPPIAPINPLESFPSTCSCSPALKQHRILAEAPLPTTAARRCPLLAVEQPFPTLLDPN
jgi:hypothetical protein